MATTPTKPASKFNQLTPMDSRFVAQIPQMSEQQILETLGYGNAIKSGGIPAAEAQFRQDHNNADPTPDKLDAVLKQATADKETFNGMGALGITTAQAYAITTAADHTGVPAQNIAKLAIAERAFDKTFKTGRQPGMIQMTEGAFMNTFAQYGGDCSRSAELHSEIPTDSAGKPKPPSEWPKDFQAKVAALQSDPLVSAQLGTMYAKTAPVQLDVVNTYQLETAGRNGPQLNALMQNVGGLTNKQANIVLNPSDPEWCAATVDSGMAGAGITPRLETRGENDPGKPTLLAADYAKFGTPIPHPSVKTVKPGDVVVFKSPSHVAMVSKVNPDGTFMYLGGNQSSRSNVDENGPLRLTDPGVIIRSTPPGAFANATSSPLPAPPPADPAAAAATPSVNTTVPVPAPVPAPAPTVRAPAVKAPAPP